MTLDAARLVGLLAQSDRRRIIAALILESGTPEGLASRSGVPLRAVMDALARLTDAGLVEAAADGSYVILEEAFTMAARAAAPAPRRDHPEEPPDVARVLDTAFRDGRLIRLPAKQSKRLVVLDHLAQRFEPGVRYTERQVNASLVEVDEDTATLRRYLVDHGFLERAGGVYWRSGGTVGP